MKLEMQAGAREWKALKARIVIWGFLQIVNEDA